MKREIAISPGHATIDDFGSDGDDPVHIPIAHHSQHVAIQADGSFSAEISQLQTVDVVFPNYLRIIEKVLAALEKTGRATKEAEVQDYLLFKFTLATSLSIYAKENWLVDESRCFVG
jgi:hypothetical protein